MTLDQIVEEARRLPREQVAELVERLRAEVVETIDPQIDAAWRDEARRRLQELETGQVQDVPGDEVSERVRQIVTR